MGAIICEEQGIAIACTLLSQDDWSGWRLKNDYIAVNPKLCELIREAGDHYWSSVLRKEVPAFIQSEILELDPSSLDEWPETAQRLAELYELSRSEERRVGKECVRTCKYRWSPNEKQKKDKTQ